MQPIEHLLHRIQWDTEFGKGSFTIGYYDRVTRCEELVPFESIALHPERPGTFTLLDEHGVAVRIPLHRVRTVYKDGAVIWQRPPRSR